MSPAEPLRTAGLVARMAPWALALPVLKRGMPLPRLARLMGTSRDRPRDPARERRIARVAWWVSRAQPRQFPDNCLERSLVTYRFLSLAGADPRLVVGLARNDAEIIGHAWVTIDDEPVQDQPDALARFPKLIEFGRDGVPTPESDSPLRREKPNGCV